MNSKVALAGTEASKATVTHHGGFEALNDELDYTVPLDQVKGTIPASVRGTFFRIGPGRNKIGGQKFGHWFDGDGMLHAVSFKDDGVVYRNRYVRTPKYLAETKANKIVMRSFGHNAPGGIRKNIGRLPANCANTSLIYHGGKLLALWEGGRPWQLDPATLDTIGEHDYNGKLGKFNAFSAHGKVNPRTGVYYNFGIRPSFTLTGALTGKGAIDLYKIAPSGHLVDKGSFEVDFLSFCHDFALTEHYMVFFQSPIAMKSPAPWLAGLIPFDQAIAWRPELGMKIYVVRTADFKVEKVFTVDDPFVAIHFSNAWETSDGVIEVDLTRFEDFSVNELLRDVFHSKGSELGGTFWRYRLDLKSGRLESRQYQQALSGEFPQWDHRHSCQPTSVMYAACGMSDASSFFDGVERIDLHTGDVISHFLGDGRYTSEAVHIAPGPEDDNHEGWLVSMVYDARTHSSEVVLFDARTLDEVAVVPLNNHVPFGFHGGYSPKTFIR
ncbi:MAG: carotenoid oxygenase family protein [Gammaproteobacteria bacterium]